METFSFVLGGKMYVHVHVPEGTVSCSISPTELIQFCNITI